MRSWVAIGDEKGEWRREHLYVLKLTGAAVARRSPCGAALAAVFASKRLASTSVPAPSLLPSSPPMPALHLVKNAIATGRGGAVGHSSDLGRKI
ncbi:hypothetical protein B296_00026906 [Ensete ventricosum]|uniref:Uncharacterized protein n=1 Tax=Ensete ventricosum TaxID=4639 RepID=A0A426ZM89_ENSVE|nr:hypothetical protein B296_00026906 [Ensete ventricosum]